MRRLAGVGATATGFTCRGRGYSQAWTQRGVAHTFEFARCHRQTSVPAGTIVYGSKLALTVCVWAAHVVLPWIHWVSSNFKGWARGVHHGLLPKYSQSNLEEFVFRFNRRTPRHAAFRSLFDIAPAPNPLHTKS